MHQRAKFDIAAYQLAGIAIVAYTLYQIRHCYCSA